jgi:hypothetical protein
MQLDVRPGLGVELAVVSADDAVARGLAAAKDYAFVTADYSGRAAPMSQVFDTDGTTGVLALAFDPGFSGSPTTAFHCLRRQLPDAQRVGGEVGELGTNRCPPSAELRSEQSLRLAHCRAHPVLGKERSKRWRGHLR